MWTTLYVALKLSLAIFQPCELVATSLQSSASTARSALVSLQLLPQNEVLRLALLETLDLVIAGLERRFDTPGPREAVAREQAALEGLLGKQTPELETLQLPPSFDRERLKCQMSVRSGALHGEKQPLADVRQTLSKMEETTRRMFSEVARFLELILILPCTVASVEKSFSML